MTDFDVIVIGGGFYGCCIALHLSHHFKRVALFEKEDGILKKASSINQARVHAGYHYPRSLLTATSSFRNYTRFTHDFHDAIIDDVQHIYAVTKYATKTSVNQFYYFFKKMGAYITPLHDTLKWELFNSSLIENAFFVHESIYDWVILKKILLDRLHHAGVNVFFNQEILRIEQRESALGVINQHNDFFSAKKIFSCVYADANQLRMNSHLSTIPFKYQLAELPLIKPPPILQKRAITIMDGQFFTMLPYPTKDCHTVGHVRYTNHCSWTDPALVNQIRTQKKQSNFIYMKKDAARFMPQLADIENQESLYEIRTLLQNTQHDDGRPILFYEDKKIKNFFTVVGGKIDNIYDILDFISSHVVS